MPWAGAVATAWRGQLGASPAGREALSLLQSTITTGTARSYNSKWLRFAAFCERDGWRALPASEAAVLAYLGDVARSGTVAAKNLQPYLSAINKVHGDLRYPRPALGPAVVALQHALALAQMRVRPRDVRLPLPPMVALAVLHLGLTTPDPHLLRVATCLVVNYLWFYRPGTGAAMLAGDLGVAADGSWVIRLRSEKQRTRAGDASRRLPVWPAAFLAGPLALLQRWQHYRWSVGLRSADLPLWALPGERPPRPASLDAWHEAAVRASGFVPPPGFSLAGYMARKGAATAAFAISVPLERIKYYGGWSVGSSVVVKDYIDLGERPSDAALLWFGGLLHDQRAPPSFADWWAAACAAAAALRPA